MRVTLSLAPDEAPALVFVTDASAPTTEQSCAVPAPRLDEYWQLWVSPSSATVTVTFAHQGAVEVKAGDGWVEAEARARAASARITFHSFVPTAPSAQSPSPPEA